MDLIGNLDLLSVATAVAGTFILGFTVFFSNSNSTTNKTFLFLSIVTGLWGLTNFFGHQVTDPEIALVLLRGVMFLAVLQAFAVFQFFYVFPNGSIVFPKFYRYFLVPLSFLTAIISSTPLVLSKVVEVSDSGVVTEVLNGPAIPLFGVVSVGLVVSALAIFIRNLRKATGDLRKGYVKILFGTAIMFGFIIVFNFIFPVFFHNPTYIGYGALFTFPFILLTSYAIYKHKLLNIKLAYVSLITFILAMFSFFNIVFAQSLGQVILNVTFFVVILFGSITLIRTIIREVKQKEALQDLNSELRVLIAQRESLVHLITHKVKGSFTRTKFLFAEMLEGSFGPLSDTLRSMTERGLQSDIDGIATVDLVLNSANLQSGSVKYDMKETNFKDLLSDIVSEKIKSAEAKKLKMNLNLEEGNGETYNILGDSFWLKEVIINLLENSIKYTIQGEINVGLSQKNNKVIFSVIDTGVGITDEDKKNLFTEGGRGKDSVKVNVDSTGYGLFSAKLIVEAHKGRIWAQSDGKDKGSKFFVEFDVFKE